MNATNPKTWRGIPVRIDAPHVCDGLLGDPIAFIAQELQDYETGDYNGHWRADVFLAGYEYAHGSCIVAPSAEEALQHALADMKAKLHTVFARHREVTQRMELQEEAVAKLEARS